MNKLVLSVACVLAVPFFSAAATNTNVVVSSSITLTNLNAHVQALDGVLAARSNAWDGAVHSINLNGTNYPATGGVVTLPTGASGRDGTNGVDGAAGLNGTNGLNGSAADSGLRLLGELRRGIIGTATNLEVKIDTRFSGTGCVQWVSSFLESPTNYFLAWCENPTHSITTNCVVGVGRLDLTGNPIGSTTYPLANDLTNAYSIGSLFKTSAGSYLLSYDARNPGNGAASTYPLIVMRSTNSGTSWLKSTTLTSSGSSYRVTSPGDMAQVGATIFLPVYWSNDGGAHDNAGYVTSTDDGQTWTTNPVALATWSASTNSISEASFFAPQSTNLIAWLRNDTSSTLYFSISTTTGATWSALATTMVPSMLHARSTAVDASNNVLVARSTGASGYQLTTLYRFSTPLSLTNAIGQTIDARGTCQYGSPMRLPNQQVGLLYCLSTNVWNNFARMALAYVALAPGVSPLGDAFLIGPAAAVQVWQTPFIYYTSGTAAQTLPTWCPGYFSADYQYNYGFTTNGFPICTAYATAPSTATQVIWRFDAAFQAGLGTDHWIYASTSFLTPTTSVRSTSDNYKSNTYFYGSTARLVSIYDTNTCAGGYPVQFYLRKPGTQSANGGWTNNNPAIWLGVGVRFSP